MSVVYFVFHSLAYPRPCPQLTAEGERCAVMFPVSCRHTPQSAVDRHVTGITAMQDVCYHDGCRSLGAAHDACNTSRRTDVSRKSPSPHCNIGVKLHVSSLLVSVAGLHQTYTVASGINELSQIFAAALR